MARIYKRERIWYLDIRVSGRRIRRKVGTSKKVALLALQDAVVKAERQEFGFAKKDATITKFIQQFLEHSAANHRSSTTNRYRAVTDHFQSFLNAKRQDVVFLSLVNEEVIDQHKVYRKDEWTNPNGSLVEDVKEYTRKGARAHTINFEISALRTVFNSAIKWGYLRDNPTKSVKKLKVDDAKPVNETLDGAIGAVKTLLGHNILVDTLSRQPRIQLSLDNRLKRPAEAWRTQRTIRHT